MKATNIEHCPGCCAGLPALDGPSHRYIGASPACWAIFANLFNAGEPPLAPGALNGLIGDAYAAQHPGTPSEQAIQSVAVHLLALYGVLKRGVAPGQVLWIRQRTLRQGQISKRGRFQWLSPPSFEGSLTVAAIAQSPTPQTRANLAQDYVIQVWSLWSQKQLETIAAWYDAFVV